MAGKYWVTPGGAAPDQIVAEHWLTSHPPPKVNEGPVSTSLHWQVASAGASEMTGNAIEPRPIHDTTIDVDDDAGVAL